jgi:hypothetical protein
MHNSLRLDSLRLVIVKAQIVKLVILNELKSTNISSVSYMLTSAREVLVKLIKEVQRRRGVGGGGGGGLKQ